MNTLPDAASGGKPTPGPWKRGLVEHNPCGYTVEIDGGKPSETIAIVECYEGDESNLSLLLATPELLAACKGAVHLLRRLPVEIECEPECDVLQAAIAKATGGAP